MEVVQKLLFFTDCMGTEWHLRPIDGDKCSYQKFVRMSKVEEKVVTNWDRNKVVDIIKKALGGERNAVWQEQQDWFVKVRDIPVHVRVVGVSNQNRVKVTIDAYSGKVIYNDYGDINICQTRELKSEITRIVKMILPAN